MPRKPNSFWRGKVKQLTVNNDERKIRFGPESVLSALKADFMELSEAHRQRYGPPPSKATIGRIQRDARKMSKEEREQYLWFYWPESMGQEGLPWEASRPLLHLLAQDLWLGLRPQIQVCRWYWKLYQAAPDAPHHRLENLARMLATREMQGPIPDYKLRGVEGSLAFRSWVTVEDGHRLEQMAYDMAVQFRFVPPLDIDFEEPAESNLDDMTSRREMFTSISREVARHQAQIEAAERADRERRGEEEWAKFKEQRRISGRPLPPGFLQESDSEEWFKFQEEQRHISEGVMSPEVEQEQEKEDTYGEAQT